MTEPRWTPAVVAAVIDVELQGTKPAEKFSRDHVVALKNAGCTKTEVRAYLESVFGAMKVRRGGDMVSAVDHVMGDLDSYGMWGS